ncbi:TPA: ferritin-like domain-containing protein [Klebsiella quasipneumoniae subsp. similipneumoniae]|uniref:ferritin-like domain-containing protein n=1 Tax=Klebsiella quasipneumoniae TaxID=1463165 RepID=UPI0010336B8B|nr:ferritin-like domain-containing protein [Klebsiella quasipneumoniae]HBR1485429.1 ferritin-like domain-containing protein [Klebsiella quasipneumoniae subsp. similipneumoniae]MBY7162753.1 ferritin-like domain-containing protein [Klebsiella quasipneumoniae]MDU2918918.1 ferritin-like domain-containing protein [Klebsiella quasipneumoniae]HBQ8758838.1 ferritin-like domain-containing protein [Klebsiella quasipneumoniae]HBR1767047.1 ferritin-like domain-containing protein [Klebsiella quasipneumonia
MTDSENYHNWLRDAHAMEKQAESLLMATIRRLDNEPQLRTRLEQHLYETRRQLSALQDLIARNHISRSALKDAMSRVAALGQTIGIMLPGDELIKLITTAYVFAHFEVACYTALLTAAKRVGDHSAMPTLEGILAEERGMADWLLHHLPALTGQYLMHNSLPGVEAGQ